jgi:hypothetical protein
MESREHQRVLYRNTNSHALFAAEIQYFMRENVALSAVFGRGEQLLVATRSSFSKGAL